MKNSKTKLVAAAMAMALGLLWSAGPASARFDDDPEEEGNGGGGSGPIPAGPPAYQFPETGFTWKAPKRAGLWKSAWAEYGTYKAWPMDTYDPQYVNPSSWDLYFQGCQTEADFRYDLDNTKGKGTNLYRWKWNKQVQEWSSDCYTTLEFPSQGTYYVTLDWKGADNVIHTRTLPVRVKDYLIVQLGDSMAAGEGAPDVPIHQWDTTANADWVDDRCHRSDLAGGPLAAKALEDADDHSSVTFLSFACSGATLTREQYNGYFPFDPYFVTDYASKGVGMTDGFVGIEPPLDSTDNFVNFLPSQTEQLYDAVTNHGSRDPRYVDVLMATGGINDVRFAALVANCMFGPDLITPCQFELVGPLQTPLDAQFQEDLQGVQPGWATMKEQLQELGVVSGKRLAIEYPPLFHDEEGDPCAYLFSDILPPNGWNYFEAMHANDVWARDLNNAVKAGATANQFGNAFEWVGGIAADFNTHGMCATDNWFNTPTESAHRQGDDRGNPGDTAILSTTGLAHPNPKGYENIAARILEHTGNIAFNEKPVGGPDNITAGKNVWSYFNVLNNDTDPEGDPLSVRRLSQPLHGHVSIKPWGQVSYKPDHNYTGSDFFAYELTDGEHAVTVGVNITVIAPFAEQVVAMAGEVTEIPLLTSPGSPVLTGPFVVVMGKELKPKYGTIYQEDDDTPLIAYDVPPRVRRKIKIPYTVYSLTDDVTSPSYGAAVCGTLKIRVQRQ